MPDMSEEVLRIMAKPDADENDLLYLFYPDTDAARASGFEHLANVSKRLAAGGPRCPRRRDGPACSGWADPVGSVRHGAIEPGDHQAARPLANGVHDVMIPALASYVAVEHLDSAVSCSTATPVTLSCSSTPKTSRPKSQTSSPRGRANLHPRWVAAPDDAATDVRGTKR